MKFVYHQLNTKLGWFVPKCEQAQRKFEIHIFETWSILGKNILNFVYPMLILHGGDWSTYEVMLDSKLYIPSTPNNSNETPTFMCLGRTGRFGQR